MRAARLATLLAVLLVAGWWGEPARAEAAWTWPLRPAPHLVHPFSPPAHDWLPGHRGVDLAGTPGQAVRAAGPGRVVFAGRVGPVGVVALRHDNGLETTYQPVEPTVRQGAVVTVGGVIGHLTVAGSHCAPAACLHWGLLRRGPGSSADYLDPLVLVGAARVRLLPLLGDARGTSWLVPAASGASVGSSAVALGWAVVVTRRRRRPLPPGVASLARARSERDRRTWTDADVRDDVGPRE